VNRPEMGVSTAREGNQDSPPAAVLSDPPFVLPETVELRQDIVYAEPSGQQLRLDLFLPRERREGAPGVVYLHGGGWRAGSPRQFWRHAAHMASLGCTGVCAQYRFVPRHTFPSQLEDAQAAVRWLRRQAGEFGVDPQRIGAVGGSAGAHLAALLGTTDDMVAGIRSKVKAVVAFNGVFDLVSRLSDVAGSRALELLGGEAAKAKDASPYWQADSTTAAMLLLHGDADTTVPYEQSAAFERRLRELGVRCDLYPEPGASHGFFNRSPYYQRTLPLMERFLLREL
jgi:acetyl esterase/lipase